MRTDSKNPLHDATEAALPSPGDRLSMTEAAREAGCSVRYLQKLAKAGRGPSRMKWAGRVWYSRKALAMYFDQLERQP